MTKNSKPKIVVIVGPTASGKTALAIAIAKEFSGEVISADSRQVYRRLDIGTEKVTEEEMAGIPHHLLDVCEPENVYTAADFKRDGTAAINDISGRQKLPIIAGGTFFYVDTLIGRITTPPVEPDPELREKLEAMETSTLYESLLKLDPRRAEDIDPNNKRRLMRALEVVHALGAVPPQTEDELPFEVLTIGIETDRTKLRERISARAAMALERGLVEETKGLLESGINRARLTEVGLEYRLIMKYIDGEMDDEELIQRLEEKNWQYAKKQLTWLKRDETIEWFRPEDHSAIFDRIKKFLTIHH